MNLIEALRSGRRLKQSGDSEWFSREAIECSLTIESVLADDWEIEPEKDPKPKVWRNEDLEKTQFGYLLLGFKPPTPGRWRDVTEELKEVLGPSK